MHAEDAQNLEHPGSDKVLCWLDIKGMKPSGLLSDGSEILVGNSTFKVIHTPGHSPGGVCFYLRAQNVLFSGDTLFQGSIGALHLPTGNPSHMWESLRKLSLLPKETRVIPGHGDDTTIGDESWLAHAKELFS